MNENMFELIGTHFERGVLILRLENPVPRLIRPVVRLGAVKGRLLALMCLGIATLLTFKHQPMRWLLDHALVADRSSAAMIQLGLTYLVAGVGTLIYLVVFFIRSEQLELEFDRTDQCLRFAHLPRMAKLSERKGLCDFKSIEKIEVFSKEKTPLTSNGYIKITLKGHPEPYREISFKLLSDEQFKIYPANLMRVTGVTPVGDFTDPDDALA